MEGVFKCLLFLFIGSNRSVPFVLRSTFQQSFPMIVFQIHWLLLTKSEKATTFSLPFFSVVSSSASSSVKTFQFSSYISGRPSRIIANVFHISTSTLGVTSSPNSSSSSLVLDSPSESSSPFSFVDEGLTSPYFA